MPTPTPALTIADRMAIFAAVVEAQDQFQGDIVRAREDTAQRFKVSEALVRAVEDEGVEGDWPLP